MMLILECDKGDQKITCAADFEKDPTYGEWHCVEAAPIVGWMKGAAPRRIKRWLDGPGKEKGWRYYWSNETPSKPAQRAQEAIPEIDHLKHMGIEVWQLREGK